METTILDLKTRWIELKKNNPHIRIRDAAEQLGASEAELLATRCGEDVVRLEGDWTALIKEFPKLGEVMCLTRNHAAVHERYGVFEEIAFFHGMGQVVGTDIDLRFFMSSWQYGFAVTDETKDGAKRSFQFFDAGGIAVHKVYIQKEEAISLYSTLVGQYRSGNQSPEQTVSPIAGSTPEKPDSEIDVSGFREGWLGLKDTHEFFGHLKKFGVTRTQALRLAPDGYAWKVEKSGVELLLEMAATKGIPIMIFIGNAGCIQIHTGEVRNIKRFGTEWLNVLDEKFNMHLREPLVYSAWVVRKCTKDGIVTSVELYDAKGENIVLFFGKRKPGQSEDEAWRGIVASLPVASI